MKKILFLIMTVIVAFGCSDDDQYVSFSSKEIVCGPEGGTFTIDIDANCEWRFNSSVSSWESPEIETEIISKNQIRIHIKENNIFIEKTSTIIIASSNGSSSDELRIVQKENRGIISDNEKDISIPYVGGIFTIDIKSNIDDIAIQAPSWISHIQSKAINNSVYQFSCKKNDEYQKRSGEIIFKGENKELKFNITQNAAPVIAESVQIADFKPLVKGKQTIIYDINYYPADSDLDMLKFTSSNENVCKVRLENGKLRVDFIGYGESVISCSVNEQDKCRYNVKCVDTDTPFYFTSDGNYTEYPFNGHIWLSTNKDWEYVNVSISDNDLVSPGNFKQIYNVRSKAGKLRITAEYTLTGEKSSIEINIVPFAVRANILRFREIEEGVYFTFVANLQYGTAIEGKTFIIKDANNKVIDFNGGKIEGYDKYISSEIFIEKKNYVENVLEFVKGYKITVSAKVLVDNDNGGMELKEFSVTKDINTLIVGDI